MLKKICGLARALYIVLAIVTAFFALPMINVPLLLVVLGLIAGIAMAKENYVPAAATAIVLPIIGAALAQIPTIGAQLATVTANLQLGVAGALASALAIVLYHFVLGDLTGIAGDTPATRKAATAG
jgi:hypothetical protein